MTDATHPTSEQEPSALRWCVGKFAYVRGAPRPIHFMELKSFVIDDAVDYSHLFYLRALRQRAQSQELDAALQRWMDGTAVKPLAELVVRVLERTGARTVEEIYPGVGLTFEYLKLLLSARLASRGESLRYTGVGPDASRRKLLTLHADEDPPARYVTEEEYRIGHSPRADAGPILRVYNQNQELRQTDEGLISLAEFMSLAADGPAVLSLRVTCASGPAARTTVKGRHVVLPALGDVLTACRAARDDWTYRLVERFDSGFFLPDTTGETGAFLAFGGAGLDVEPGFKRLSQG